MAWSIIIKDMTLFTSVLKIVSLLWWFVNHYIYPSILKEGLFCSLIFLMVRDFFPKWHFQCMHSQTLSIYRSTILSLQQMQEYKTFSLGKFPVFFQKAILPLVHFCFNAGPNSAQSTRDWCGSIFTSGLSSPKWSISWIFFWFCIVSIFSAGLPHLKTWQFLSFPCTLSAKNLSCWLIIFLFFSL